MMEMRLFETLSRHFKEKGFSLYMVGGTTRDFLLGRACSDWDLATDANPEELRILLPKADITFLRYGVIRLKTEQGHVDITSFREEGDYQDFRHPQHITFVRSWKEDAKRRDLTINALYRSADGTIYDAFQGQRDLKERRLRMIGNPFVRFKEDPLRILRVLRFSLLLEFEIEKETEDAMRKTIGLLKKLSKAKMQEEIKKMMVIHPQKAMEMLHEYGIDKIVF